MQSVDHSLPGRLIFREYVTPSELRQALSLRFKMYSEVGHGHVASMDSTSGLELNGYDVYSRHFGLFSIEAGREELVGNLRFTSEERSPQADMLESIANASPNLQSRLHEQRLAPLPMLSLTANDPAVQRAYDGFRSRGERLVEAGRFTILASYRLRAGRRCIRLSERMIECGFAIGVGVMRGDRSFLTCEERLVNLYAPFGYSQLPGSRAEYQEYWGYKSVTMSATLAGLPPERRTTVNRLLQELELHGQIEVANGAPRNDASEAEKAAQRHATQTRALQVRSYPTALFARAAGSFAPEATPSTTH